MIRFDLTCSADHRFDSWFQSGAAFDTVKAAGMLACPTCGSSKVDKALMAPPVSKSVAKTQIAPLQAKDAYPKTALAKMRAEVEANSEYVGKNFATQARKMHDGDTPERAIYGEAKPEEARKPIQDGIAVIPLPFIPKRKTN